MLTLEQRNKIDATKYCTFCGSPVASGRGWSAVGMCTTHRAMWVEDIAFGLWRRNRLRDLILLQEQTAEKTGSQLILEL